MSQSFPEEVQPVRPSRWRAAVVLATLAGGTFYLLGRLAATDEAGRFPSILVILSVSLAPFLCTLAFAGWWVIWGDGRFRYRLLTILGGVLLTAGDVMLADETMRPFVFMWGVALTVALTGLFLAVTPRAWRPGVGVVMVLLTMAPWWMLVSDGVTGSYEPNLYYRWRSDSQELVNARLAEQATTKAVEPAKLTSDSAIDPADWPGFRGASRTGEVPVAASAGWSGSQPREKWRRGLGKVGGAWSSFCVVGNSLFTQEQRGKSESVVCYKADSGDEIWARGEPGEHKDQPSGAGPRATPTYANGFIYAETATGTIVCLKADTGDPVWTVKLPERFQATKPMYGWSTSPLAAGNLVIVNPASVASPRLVALDAATGETKWKTEANGTDGYSSPHPAAIQGVEQVLVFNGNGLFGHDPATGRELWHYDWHVAVVEPTTVQPLVLPGGRVVIGGGNIGLGVRCVSVRKEGDSWTATESWKTTRFTPKFNDVVRRGDHLFGLDNGSLVCLKLANGEVAWKEGDYGSGQLLLAGDKLLVLSEKGQLACVSAKADEYEELWKINAVKGKTWNHPVISHGRLFVRNMGEIVAYDLAPVEAGTK